MIFESMITKLKILVKWHFEKHKIKKLDSRVIGFDGKTKGQNPKNPAPVN